MVAKKKEKDKSILGSILSNSFDKSAGVADSIARVFVAYLDQVYHIEKRIDDIREDAEKKAEEIKEDAIETAYAIKRSLIRSLLELIFLATGIIAIIIGALILLSRQARPEVVLLGYGILVTIGVLVSMKTSR